MFGKDVRVFMKDQAKDSYLLLKSRSDKESQSLLNSINRIIDILKNNPQYGNPIPKRLIPKSLIKEGIQNLYRVELSNFWRMLYTIEGTKIEILVFVLKIMNHKEYNKLFGYK
jgi:Txe/YoeB family toxin of Txe-Axe toxin-antitoxin module|tara:strand:- start:8244 stop:8582 length:339 start_codon:yes stop_codon:yes gene_type:complete